MSLTLTTVRYYTSLDPYIYSVDNRPLQDLNDRDNQIVTELNRRTYVGDITGASAPVVNQLPAGWTIVANGVGDYTITHNMGAVNYGVQISVVDTTGGFGNIYSFDLNTIRVVTRTTAGAAAHKRFMLLVTGY